MDGQLTVEVADLRGWASQVRRAGGDCAYLADYVTTFVPDGEFGRVLSLITHSYERVARSLCDNVATAAARLGDTSEALDHSASSYERVDRLAAESLGVASPGDVTEAPSEFSDIRTARPSAPSCAPVDAPSLSFGPPLDQGLALLVRLGGPDVRTWVTEQLSGDLDKAMRQAIAWEEAGSAIAGARANMVRGSAAVSRTWEGVSAMSSAAYTAAWIDVLDVHSRVMASLAEHLRDAVSQAVALTQLIVDCLHWIASVLLAAWTLTGVPIFGLLHAVRSFKEAVVMVWRIKKVLDVFTGFLSVMNDVLVLSVDVVTGEPLPAAPSLGGGTA